MFMSETSPTWQQLSEEDLRQRFGRTTRTEKPTGWKHRDGRHFMVLREGAGDEGIWWSFYRAESGEYVELARNYGQEHWDAAGSRLEIHWSGQFPVSWVADFLNGRSNWLRLSVAETLENFGTTVEEAQPCSYRHRDGAHFLVLLGSRDAEGREEYVWAVVKDIAGLQSAEEGSYEEIAEFGSHGEDEEELISTEGEELPESWWKEPPFEWADSTVATDSGADG